MFFFPNCTLIVQVCIILIFFLRKKIAWRGKVWKKGGNTMKLPTVPEMNVFMVQGSIRDSTEACNLITRS